MQIRKKLFVIAISTALPGFSLAQDTTITAPAPDVAIPVPAAPTGYEPMPSMPDPVLQPMHDPMMAQGGYGGPEMMQGGYGYAPPSGVGQSGMSGYGQPMMPQYDQAMMPDYGQMPYDPAYDQMPYGYSQSYTPMQAPMPQYGGGQMNYGDAGMAPGMMRGQGGHTCKHGDRGKQKAEKQAHHQAMLERLDAIIDRLERVEAALKAKGE